MLLLLLAACGHHIADPHLPAPIADTPAASDLTVCWVEFSRGTLPHGMVVAHGALKDDVVSTQSGLLLIHPSGTWLIDGGSAAGLDAELKKVKGLQKVFLSQAAKGWTRVATPADALRADGVDPTTLTGVIPTHGHFDHLGGLLDLPGVPVVLPQAEIDAAQAALRGEPSGVLPDEATALLPRAKPLIFEPTPFLLWPESHDLFGDGSVVLTPMPGHTPGSLGARIALPDGRRLMLVGDTVWVKEGYEDREPKGWIAQNFDADGPTNDLQIARLAAIHAADPGLTLLPAHDRRVWEQVFGQPGCVRR